MKSFKQVCVFVFALALVAVGGCMSFNQVTLFSLSQKQPLRAFPIGGDPDARDIAVFVDVQGIIVDVEEKQFFGLTGIKNTVSHVHAVLEKAAEDPDVRGIVVRINSPGGTVTASDLVYHEITRFKERHPGIPVYAMMMDLATSGGYYTAVAADKIWAHPTTITGSIGVIVQGINLAGLFDKIGIKDQTVKSGAHKDMLSPLRPSTPEDQAIMQSVVDGLYGKFLDRVKTGRPKVEEARLRKIADGRVLTAEQAKAEGLVDEIGYFNDMMGALAKDAGVPSLKAVIYRNEAEIDDNMYVSAKNSNLSPDAVFGAAWLGLLSGTIPGGSPFLYVWPGALGIAGQ